MTTTRAAHVIAHVEIRGIQAYVFRTGRLRDTIGRSVLVESLTDPDQPPLSELLGDGVELVERRSGSFDVTGTPEAVRRFVAAYTRALAVTTRELRLVVAYDDPDVANPAVTLARARLQSPEGLGLAPLLGVERCVLTGGSAETLWRRPGVDLPVVAEVLAARERGRTWHDRFEKQALSHVPHFALPVDMESIAPSKQESSRVAVVVADLNGLGDKLALWASLGRSEDAGDILRRCMKELGVHLARTAADWVESTEGGYRTLGVPEHLRFELATHAAEPGEAEPVAAGSRSDLPFAPVILGGDDLVFVCESRLALGLVQEVVHFFDAVPEESARAELAKLGGPFATNGRIDLTFGVGVAIDKVGYSLQRVHDRAELLAKAAKRRRRLVLADRDAPDHHAVSWTTLRWDPHRSSDLAEARVYVTTADAVALGQWLHDNSRTGVELLDSLLDLLDPKVPGSLRSDDAAGSELAPWSQQRSWLKTELAKAIRTHRSDATPASRSERRAKLEDALAARGPEMPRGVGRGLSDHKLELLGDALVLLDEHLTLPASYPAAHKELNP